jgi:flagellar biosynthetic protein FliQ
MSDAQVLQIVTGALALATKLAAPTLLATLVIGSIVSILQTITQVQEMSLTFVPKLVGVGLILVFAGNWMMREFVTWVTALWGTIPALLGSGAV